MTTILGISGSLRSGSFNTHLLQACVQLMPEGAKLETASIRGVPIYDGDVESEQGIPAAVVELKQRLMAADGLLIVTPEYNGGIPGPFKNAIDWMSRPSSDIPRVFGGRPVATMGASPGKLGTALSQRVWLGTLRHLRMEPWFGSPVYVANAEKVFDAAGTLTDEDTKKHVAGFLRGYVTFVAKHAEIRVSATAPVVNVDELIDNQPLRARSWIVFALLLIALLCDGFDLQLLSFAAPSLVREWGVSRPALGPVFSANLFGMMVGAIVLGSLGDRFGRKKVIVGGTFLYSLATLACLATHSLWELGTLRFITGVGLGGVLPNVIALSAELTAKRVRALVTSFVVIGMSLGSSVTGYVSRAPMIADEGWHGLFLVGAVVPFAIGVILLLALPESLSFLARSPARRAALERRVRVLDPSLAIGPETQFVLRHRELQEKPGVARLFAGELKIVTPALWLLFAGTLLSMYLMTSWMPTLFEAAGLSRGDAAGITSLFHLGGVAAGVLTAFLLGSLGLVWILVLLVLGAVGVAGIALTGFERDMLTVLAIVAGFGIVGCQSAINASAGLIYPSSIRPTGVGAALGVGRTGSIIGPSVGAVFLAAGLSTQHMFYLPLIPIGFAIVGAAILVARRVDIRSGGATH